MKIYWSLKQIPELAGLSRRERNIAFKAFCSQHMMHARPNRWSIAAWFAVFFLMPGSMVLARSLLEISESSDLVVALAGCAGFILGIFLHFQISANYMRRFVRDHTQTIR